MYILVKQLAVSERFPRALDKSLQVIDFQYNEQIYIDGKNYCLSENADVLPLLSTFIPQEYTNSDTSAY